MTAEERARPSQALTGEGDGKQKAAAILRQLGMTRSSTELQQAVRILSEKGIAINKAALKVLQRFLDSGNIQERLYTVEALADKRLELNENQLNSIHEALHGKRLNHLLNELVSELRGNSSSTNFEGASRSQITATDELLRQLRALLLQKSSLTSEQVRTLLQGLDKQEAEALLQSLQAVQSNQRTVNADSNAALPFIRELQEMQLQLQTEASLTKALEMAASLLREQSGLNEAMRNKLEQVIEQAKGRQQEGRELAARQLLHDGLQQIEDSIRAEAIRTVQGQVNYTENERFQTGIEVESKQLAVTTITEKLADAANEFRTLQREVSRTLDQIIRQIEQLRSKAHPHVKPSLDMTIKKLDQAILRSEMMLYSDMKTEKQLMHASSQLAEAKKLLSRGSHQEASRIVQEVKQLIERVQYQPSETRVKQYASLNERQYGEVRPQTHQEISRQIGELAKQPQDSSPRAMLEMLRARFESGE